MEQEQSRPRHPLIVGITRALECLLIVAMAVLVLDVLWGVLSRMLTSAELMHGQSSWTEELARYLMVWVGLLGASLAFERGSHLGLDFFFEKLHPFAARILRVFVLLIVLCFAVFVLIVGGWELMSRTFALGQTAPALGIAKGWVYMVVPLSGCFVVVFTLVQIFDTLVLPLEDEQKGGA